jgi:hypothetical protein
MFRSLKAFPLALAIAALSLVTTGCGKNSTQVRVINAMANTGNPGVDVEFNTVNPFNSAIAFGDVLPAQQTAGPATYRSVPSGTDTIQVFTAGSTTNPIVTNSLPLDSGDQYTLVLGSGIVKQFLDNNTAPATNSDIVEVRVIDAAVYDTFQIDVYLIPCGELLNTTYRFGTIGYLDATTYYSPTYNPNKCPDGSSNYTLEVFNAGSQESPYINQPYSLAEGSITTLVIMDEESGGQPTGISPTPLDWNDLMN